MLVRRTTVRIDDSVGTDTGMTFVPQYATWRELELLVAYAGFSPAEALHAATAVNASILGVDAETGSLEVGKSADLLVLNANPLDDLRALEHPALVIAAGHPVWRPVPSVSRISTPCWTRHTPNRRELPGRYAGRSLSNLCGEMGAWRKQQRTYR